MFKNVDNNPLCFIVGGTRFAGAEKRMLNTIRLIAQRRPNVRVRVNESLFVQAQQSVVHRGMLNDLQKFAHVEINRDRRFASWRGVNSLIGIFKGIFQPLKYRGSIVHTALGRPYLDPQLLFAKRLICEVTGPNAAKEAYWLYLFRLFKHRIKFIAVSPIVACFLKNNFKDNGLSIKPDQIAVRKIPYTEIPEQEVTLSEKKNIVIYAHRLVAKKNPTLVARVFVALSDKFPNWEFRIYGGGEYETEVEKIIIDSKKDNVRYLGYKTDLQIELRSSKVFVSAISTNNYPSQAVFEALATKNAILLGSECEADNGLVDNTNGIIVSIKLHDLAQGLTQLLSDKQLEKKCEASFLFLKQRYSQEKYADEAESFYQW